MRSFLVLLVALVLSGCMAYDKSQIGFWNQCINAEAYGASYFSPYGPINFGYLSWKRVPDCKESIGGATPVQLPPEVLQEMKDKLAPIATPVK